MQKKKICNISLSPELKGLSASEIVRCKRRNKKMGLRAIRASYFKKKSKIWISWDEFLMKQEIKEHLKKWQEGQNKQIAINT